MKIKRTSVMIVAMATLMFASFYAPAVAASPEPLELMVYKTTVPAVTADYVVDIAHRMFNMTAPIVTYVDGLYCVNNSYPRVLTIWEASGGFWYADLSKWGNETYEPVLPTEPEAYEHALAFLKSYDLLPPEMSFAGFGNATTTFYSGDTNETLTIVNSIHVNFRADAVDPSTHVVTPVEGGGAEIKVCIGDRGEIIGVDSCWRKIAPYEYYPAITKEEAIQTFRNRLGTDPAKLEVRLGYYATPGIVNQAWLQPYYIFDGTVIIDEEPVDLKTEMVPATSFSPTVSIISPMEGSRVLANHSITFTGSVLGGTPPYHYAWESNMDGTLYEGSSESFNIATLSAGDLKTGSLLPHTIKLAVTDHNGIEATENLLIVVTYLKGDINGDTTVNILDIVIAAKAFGSQPGDPRWNLIADLDNNKKVDILDIFACAREFGLTWSPTTRSGDDDLSTTKAALWFALITNPASIALTAVSLAMVMSLIIVKKRKKGLIGLFLLTIMLASAFTTSILTVSAQTRDDTNNREVGVDWVNAYRWKGALSNCDDDARGFKNKLVADGWTARFDWGDWSSWEEDFKYRNAGGTDYYVKPPNPWYGKDAVDFVYFAGHGSVKCTNEALIWFISSVDSQSFSSNNARWGGTSGGLSSEEADLEWIVLDACLTLKQTHTVANDVFARWDQAFCGLHGILGFHTTCGDTGRQGPTYVDCLRVSGNTVWNAWKQSTTSVQSSNVWGAYLRADRSAAAGDDTANDKLTPLTIGPDPYPPLLNFIYARWQC